MRLPFYLCLMSQTARISKLFQAVYEGHPWIAVNLSDTLKNISAEQAAKKVSPQWNSIWQIVNHLTCWRLNMVQRMQLQEVNVPGNYDTNYFDPVEDTSPAAWKRSLEQLADSQRQWLAYLGKMKDSDLDRVHKESGMSYYDFVHGILQHDAYHLGQIMLLAKAV